MTLTVDDDLAEILQSMAKQQGKPFKEVVNSVLRAGLSASGEIPTQRKRVKVVAKALGLKAGYGSDKLNQLIDQD